MEQSHFISVTSNAARSASVACFRGPSGLEHSGTSSDAVCARGKLASVGCCDSRCRTTPIVRRNAHARQRPGAELSAHDQPRLALGQSVGAWLKGYDLVMRIAADTGLATSVSWLPK